MRMQSRCLYRISDNFLRKSFNLWAQKTMESIEYKLSLVQEEKLLREIHNYPVMAREMSCSMTPNDLGINYTCHCI